MVEQKLKIIIGLAMAVSLTACTDQDRVFQLLPSGRTGITFSNTIETNDSINAIFFEYVYNGSGVAAADFNGDGLTDLFFGGNQVSSRLYLNRGDLHFEDVTEKAGLLTDRWCTGVAVADVNDDGRMDLYLSVAGYKVPEERMENLLFINRGWEQNGIPEFAESARAYGLNDTGYSTQAAFFDYDLDGDLDLYLLTNALEDFNRNNLVARRTNGEAPSTDRLYRNNGNETFTNVSREAGILIEGYGLGVKVTDLNFDGYPDVYTANDFQSNDLIWINNTDGTFSNQAGVYLKHQTHNGMGVDIADFNNDALPDIAVTDMLPEDNYRQKMMIPKVNYDKFRMKRNLGYEDQYMRNTVQLNQGFAPDGAPRFSEVGNLTGMAATDWSWAVLFADLDNDGWKDVYITNGYRKDVTNLDFINYSAYNQIFGSVAAKTQKAVSDLDEIAEVEVSNYLFHNKGGLEFDNVSKEWGVQHPSFTNGAVYTDLDNDGDLDLVTNNIDAEAFVFENRTRDRKQPAAGNYLQVQLVEQEKGLTAYNSKVLVYAGEQTQYQEYSPFLGYKSTVDDVLHFGLGALSAIDSLVIYWPDGRKSRYEGLTANQRFVAGYKDQGGLPGRFKPGMAAGKQHFLAANQSLGIDFRHADNEYTDLKTTRTLIRDYSKTGPALATGDINGDGLEDFFVGGNSGQAGTFYVQGADGRFAARPMLQDSAFQDVDALLFDADQDGDNDLYVVSGGTFAPPHATDYQDRLYLNDGNGNFEPAADALPEMRTSGSCVRAADYDGDGDPDLFVGGRILPGQYPLAARSYLLRNDGGIFTDLTPDHLKEPGLVTDAVWADLNGDGEVDLTIVGEWMPLTFFANNQGELQAFTPQMSGWKAPTNGWWMHVNAGDLDGDGDMDLLVGNLGLNTKLRASADQPVKLYAKDFDANGAIDPLLSCFIGDKEYLMHERDLLIDQIPAVKRRFPDYKTYAEADIAQTLSVQDLENATIETCYLFASIILRNDGNGQFHLQELPTGSQLSPVNGSLFFDLDHDGTTDILTVGNLHATETMQIGWHDASYGNLLLQNGNSLEFHPGNALAAGLQADGDVRTLKSLTMSGGQRVLLIGVYGGSLQAVSLL